MPNHKPPRRNTAEVASSPSAAASQPALGALRDIEDDALNREADDALARANALMEDGSPDPDDDERRQVAQRAFEIYKARGEQDGDDLADWLEAERQIKRTRS